MIHIKYQIRESKTHGVGLYADQEISKGDLIYTPSPVLDVDITQEQFDLLDLSEQKEVMYYGYFHKKTNKWHVAYDAIRILNHNKNSNVTQDEDMIMIASRKILKGEELFQDYAEIYPTQDDHFSRINKK